LRAKIWIFSKDLIDFAPKKGFFRGFRRAAFESLKGRGLAMAALDEWKLYLFQDIP
jgi:hypothetical protein